MEKEIRNIQIPAKVETRGEIVGYPIVYNKDSEDMGFIERIAPGAVTNALKRSDIRGLKNHDPNLIFARQGVNLTLSEDKDGLKYVATPIDTRNYKDISDEIRSGLLTGQSFGFTVLRDEWRDLDTDRPQRTITEIGEIYDVGPVVYPAYQDTSVALRSLDAARAEMDDPGTQDPQFKLAESITIINNDEVFDFDGDDRFERAAEKIEELRSSATPMSTTDDDTAPDPMISEEQVVDEDILLKIEERLERSKKQ